MRSPNQPLLGGVPFLAAVLGLSLTTRAQSTTPERGGEAPRSPVELYCKIVPAPTDRGNNLWRIELRKSTGEPIRRTQAAGGDTVRFKNLNPDIYILCLFGAHERSGCQSVDVVPPLDQGPYSFRKEFQAPPAVLNQADGQRVNVSRLAIPEKARVELARSQEAQLRGDTEDSLRHLERAVSIFPQYADALNNLGTHYHRIRNYDRSIEYFSQAAKLHPDFFARWARLG